MKRDAALLSMMRSGGRNRAWAETMVNLEARKLVEAANVISGFHLRDSLTRLQFVQEIRDVVEKQFAAAGQARTDEDCIACIKNLREETENLREQDRLLLLFILKMLQGTPQDITKSGPVIDPGFSHIDPTTIRCHT